MRDIDQISLAKHAEWRGKLQVSVRCQCQTAEDLSIAYTPGVAAPCLAIAGDPALSYVYTRRANTVAIISDGSAVLGLGNIGALAGMPVMEGKAVLFRQFAGIDAVPLVLDTQDVDRIVDTICALAPSFGGINLEDISAPRCFEIEKRLVQRLNIPVFHDDQHGTAIVVLAALLNAARLLSLDPKSLRIAVCGAGAAGSAIARLLLAFGASDIVMCDAHGILHPGRTDLDPYALDLATQTNPAGMVGTLTDAMAGADVFVGVSVGGIVSPQMVATMSKNAIVMALANPVPEIFPAEALASGARIAASGRSDFCNQINNVLAFPGVFRGALDCGARIITTKMKLAAAHALAGLVSDDQLRSDNIIPGPFDERVVKAVADAVSTASA